MKKLLLLTLVFAFFGITSYSQQNTTKKAEQMLDKYCVQTVTILNRTFNIGDTIYFKNGSSPTGEFLCSKISILQHGTMFLNAMSGTYDLGTVKNLGVENTNGKMVISKIRNFQDSSGQLVQLINIVTFKKISIITVIDPNVGLTRKEIK